MWDWLVYAALAASAAAILGGLALLAVRLLQGWRDLKRARRHLAHELDRLADSLERMTESAERASNTSELAERVDHLRTTLAQFAILREAIDEMTGTVGRVTAFIPSK